MCSALSNSRNLSLIFRLLEHFADFMDKKQSFTSFSIFSSQLFSGYDELLAMSKNICSICFTVADSIFGLAPQLSFPPYNYLKGSVFSSSHNYWIHLLWASGLHPSLELLRSFSDIAFTFQEHGLTLSISIAPRNFIQLHLQHFIQSVIEILTSREFWGRRRFFFTIF